MARRRSRLKIYVDVLRTIRGGEKIPTRIMFRTNVSWAPLMKMLEYLVSQDLVRREEESRRRRYVIREKGKKALTYFDEVARLIEVE